MSDDADFVVDVEERLMEGVLEEAHKLAHVLEVKPTGRCHYCHEPLPGDLRFCDADCLAAWEHEQKLRRMEGVA